MSERDHLDQNGLRIVKVVAVHPEQFVADVVFMDDGSRLSGVLICAPTASSNTGFNDLPTPGAQSGDDKWIPRQTDRDLFAVVGYVQYQPIILGFMYPQVSQLMFDEPGRMIHRHESDVYKTIDKDGNFELYHPSGTYLRIGEEPLHEHEDLTGKDLDEQWKIEKNLDRKVHVHLEVKNSDEGLMVMLDMAPDGKVTVVAKRDVSVTSQLGKISLTANKVITITSEEAVNVVAPVINLN